VCLTLFAGCKAKPEGPKRADNDAAHKAHYHPDVQRSNVSGERVATSEPASRPTATRFADLIEAGVIGSPVLFVNNQTITIPEVLEPIIDELQRQSRVLSERDYTDSVLRSTRDQIDYQISTLLVYQEAQPKYNDKKIQEAFDKRADELVKDIINVKYGGVRARYESHLRAVDYTPQDAKERIKRETIVREYLRDRFKPMVHEPPRYQLSQYYDEHLADFTTPERAELFLIEAPLDAEIQKDLKEATPEEREEALTKARGRIQRAKEELESGVDFAAVARSYSKGASAAQGGAWGEITRGSLTKRWAKPGEVVFTLEPGQFKVIETDQAVFLVRAGKRTPASQASFEEAQKKIIDQIVDEQFNQHRSEYIRTLLTNATINKRPEFTQALLAVVPRPPRTGQEPSLLKPNG
jgi:hypothetical protein